jgi:hypothetical protein
MLILVKIQVCSGHDCRLLITTDVSEELSNLERR